MLSWFDTQQPAGIEREEPGREKRETFSYRFVYMRHVYGISSFYGCTRKLGAASA